jgi:hypothetical protein
VKVQKIWSRPSLFSGISFFVTIHSCESNINQGLPQTCSEQSRTIAQIPQIPIQSILSIFTKQTIEGLYQSVIIGEICGKKAFWGAE